MGGDNHRLVNPTIKNKLLPHIRNNILFDMYGSQFTETIKRLAEQASMALQDVRQINARFLPCAEEKLIKFSRYFQHIEIFSKIIPVTSLLINWVLA